MLVSISNCNFQYDFGNWLLLATYYVLDGFSFLICDPAVFLQRLCNLNTPCQTSQVVVLGPLYSVSLVEGVTSLKTHLPLGSSMLATKLVSPAFRWWLLNP